MTLSGLNNQSSYSEKYLEELINNNVTDPNDAANNFPNGASLAFNTYLIDTIQGSGGSVAGYRSLVDTANWCYTKSGDQYQWWDYRFRPGHEWKPW